MAYKKKYANRTKKRTKTKVKNYMSGTGKALYTANQALNLASKVARIINSEVHRFQVLNTWSVGTTPAPVVGDIMENTTYPYSLISPKKAEDIYDSKILYDKIHHISVGGAYGSRHLTKVFPLAGHINFETASTDKENGGIYAIIMSNENTNQPTMYMYSRLSFYDN